MPSAIPDVMTEKGKAREGEKMWEVYRETVRNLGVRQQQSCRPPHDRQQSVMGVIDQGGCISQLSLHHLSENKKRHRDRCKYIFVGSTVFSEILWSTEGKKGIMNRCGVGRKHVVTAFASYIWEQQFVNIYARLQNAGEILDLRGVHTCNGQFSHLKWVSD